MHWRPWVSGPIVRSALLAIRECGAVGFSCGRIDVAEALHSVGEKSVLLTRPPVGGSGPARTAQLSKSIEVVIVCEHFAQAEVISRACEAVGSRIKLLLNLDSGRHRCGVRPGPDLSDLLEGLRTLPCVSVSGMSLDFLEESGSGLAGLAEGQLSHILNAGRRSYARVSQPLELVSLAQLHKLDELGGIAREARTPLDAQSDSPFAILSTVIGRPTRDVAVIDAGADELVGFRAGDVLSSETHFKAIRCDSSALFVCGNAQNLLVGDLIAIVTRTAAFPWATGALVGQGDNWQFAITRHGW